MITLLDTGCKSAKENMEIDRELLENLDPWGSAILHFYDWEKPSITYGYFMKPQELLSLEALQKEGIDIARRPTGGGVVFHLWDLAFSVLIPQNHPGFSENPLQNYQYINQKIQSVCMQYLAKYGLFHLLKDEKKGPSQKFENFCMAKPTQYDVMIEGKKIAGAAQRKKKQGYLHQGTISIAKPIHNILSQVLSNHPEIVEGMYGTSFYFMGDGWTKENLAEARQILRELIHKSFMETNSSDKYNSLLSLRDPL